MGQFVGSDVNAFRGGLSWQRQCVLAMSAGFIAPAAAEVVFGDNAVELTPRAGAAIVVGWDGVNNDYVVSTNATQLNINFRTSLSGTNGGDWQGDGGNDDAWRLYTYSKTNPIIPSSSWGNTQGKYDTNQASAIFYGGLEEWRVDTVGTAPAANDQARDLAAPSTVDVIAETDTNNANRRGYGIFLWNQNDFLNGGDVGVVTFSATSYATLNITTNPGNHYNWRLAVQNDLGQWYISSVSQTGTGVTTINPSSVNWAAYNPGTNLGELRANGSNAAGGLTYSSQSFTNIAAVGLYFETTQAVAANNRDLIWSQFFVDFDVSTGGPSPLSTILLSDTDPGPAYTNLATGGQVDVVGSNGGYPSEIDPLTADQNKGKVAIVDILDDAGSGPVWVMLDLAGPTSDVDSLLTALDAAGGTVYDLIPATDPFYIHLSGLYGGFFNALIKFDDSSGGLDANYFAWDFAGHTNVTVNAIAVVPEPASLAALAVGAVGLIGRRRRTT